MGKLGVRRSLVAGTALVSCAALLSSCVALFNPSTQTIPVTSKPTGAEVRIDGKFVGYTPQMVRVSASAAHTIEVSRNGESKAWTLEPHWTAGSSIGVAGDLVVLVPSTYLGVLGVAFGASDGGGPQVTALGVGFLALGVAPLVVDAATHRFVAVSDSPLEATFH